MKLALRGFALGALVSLVVQGVGGCATTEVTPPLPPSDEQLLAVPKYLDAPHPAGLDLTDLRGVLFGSAAPKRETLEGCQDDVNKLHAARTSLDELKQGVRELIRRDPVRYHWCFYVGIFDLDERLKVESYVDAKQKLMIDVYGFLVPVARAMLSEFRDSRYLRWATTYYQQVSEWIFFRKVRLTPEGTRELVEVAGPYALERGRERSPAGVLEKYNIAPPAPVEAPPGPNDEVEAVAPAPSAATPTETQAQAEVEAAPAPGPAAERDPAAVAESVSVPSAPGTFEEPPLPDPEP